MYTVKPLKCGISRKVETPLVHNYVEISDGINSCVLVQKYADGYLKEVLEMDVYDDDVWIITMPKCGTTWAIEMIWLLTNELDYETARNVNQNARCPFIE
jgi:hypothetical protein